MTQELFVRFLKDTFEGILKLFYPPKSKLLKKFGTKDKYKSIFCYSLELKMVKIYSEIGLTRHVLLSKFCSIIQIMRESQIPIRIFFCYYLFIETAGKTDNKVITKFIKKQLLVSFWFLTEGSFTHTRD